MQIKVSFASSRRGARRWHGLWRQVDDARTSGTGGVRERWEGYAFGLVLAVLLSTVCFPGSVVGQDNGGDTPRTTGNGSDAGESAAGTDADESATGADASPPAPLGKYEYRAQGIRALDDGAYGTATEFFRKYRQATEFAEPDFADATMLLVQTLLHHDKASAALDAIAYHDKHGSDIGDAYYREGLTYWKAAAERAAGNTDAAMTAAAGLADTGTVPEFRGEALRLAGGLHVQKREWPKAVETLRAFIKQFPNADDRIGARLDLARAEIALGRHEAAAETLSAAAAEADAERRPEIDLHRLLLRVAGGALDEALNIYQRIEAESFPAHRQVWWSAISGLANALMREGRNEDVLPIVPRAEDLAPDADARKDIQLARITALTELGKNELAINALAEFIADYPAGQAAITAEFRLAELLRQTENYVLASERYHNVATNTKAPTELRYRAGIARGWSFMDAEQFQNAVQAFSTSAEFGKSRREQARAYFLAGDAALRIDSYTRAAMFYQNIADNFPNSEFAEEARFKQARVRAKAELYANAAMVYKQFLEAFPDSERRAAAMLERGIVLKKAGSFEQAVKVLRTFSEEYPDDPDVPRALMEAHDAAKGMDDVPAAIALLGQLIKHHEDADLYPQAIYHRIHLRFLHGYDEAALEDSRLFLDKFSRLPRAADVLIWMGDYYANQGEAEKAEEHYLRILSLHPDLESAQVALYEAACSAHNRGAIERAERLLSQLAKDYGDKALAAVHARAMLLHGDIEARLGRYQQARTYFAAAAEKVPESRVGFAARGRSADMYYSMGTARNSQSEEARELLQKAADGYRALAENEDVPPDLRESARYRFAKACEKMGKNEIALENYLSVVYQYDVALSEGSVRDWFYFVRAGYEAAEILVDSGTETDLETAARIYERLHRAGVPTADEALQRAQDIREAHGL